MSHPLSTTQGAAVARSAAHSSSSSTVVGRRLFGGVILLQDWGDRRHHEDVENEENGAPRYWELFTDLLLVAAASSMADGFQESQSWWGLWEFVVLYSAIVHGWLLYTHHYTSRFLEPSLFHSAVLLFLYLLGMAGTIVNASLETASTFSLGVLLQRGAFVIMMIHVAVCLPRAQWFAGMLTGVVIVTMLVFLVTAVFPREDEDDHEEEEDMSALLQKDIMLFFYGEERGMEEETKSHDRHRFTLVCWTFAAIVDFSTELCMIGILSKERLVPVNIDHSKDRIGVLILVMMGETVISATMSYRSYVEHGIDAATNQALYQVLVFSFLLVFMFTLLYFHIQPHPDDHAFRRSRLTGWLAFVLSKILGLTLLIVGVCIKLAVHAVANQTTIPRFGQSLLTAAVSGSLFLLVALRACHYGGRMPRPSHPFHIKCILYFWWIFMLLACIVPMMTMGESWVWSPWQSHHDAEAGGAPIPPLAASSVWLTIVCLVDSCFTHFIDAKHMRVVLPDEEEEDETRLQHSATTATTANEQTALLPNTPHATVSTGQTSFYAGSWR
ncbi:hypothetical protein ACA910_002056 [Epithemia clementina (nom. ined.)]